MAICFQSNDLLQRVRTHGDWGAWLRWFLRGVEVTARDAAQRASELMAMRERYRTQVAVKATSVRLLDALFVNPYVSVRRAAQVLGCTPPTAAKAIEELERRGILTESTGRQWGRMYLAKPILELLQAPLRT